MQRTGVSIAMISEQLASGKSIGLTKFPEHQSGSEEYQQIHEEVGLESGT
jgi:hypothetical protein